MQAICTVHGRKHLKSGLSEELFSDLFVELKGEVVFFFLTIPLFQFCSVVDFLFSLVSC